MLLVHHILPLKINTAGVIPPIFASSLLLLPITFVSFNAGSGPEWLNTLSQFLVEVIQYIYHCILQ